MLTEDERDLYTAQKNIKYTKTISVHRANDQF